MPKTKTEFVIKVGGMFVQTEYTRWTSTLTLTPEQKGAIRYYDADMKDVINFLILHQIPYQVFRVDGQATEVDYVIKEDIKEDA